MRLLCGDACLQLLVLTTVLCVKAEQRGSKERHYYIAAVEIDWTYSGTDAQRHGLSYKKVVFREYDEDFRQAKLHPAWLGLLGPTLRAEEGETLVVTFRNLASGEYSLHPHGIAYGKQSEGAYYFDNTSQREKEDDVVRANEKHVYYWEVTPEVSPQKNDPSCLTYSYMSHKNVVEDYNSGLIGALLICKPRTLDASGLQVGVHQEFVFLFGVFDEKESKNKPKGYALDNHVKYTINGYTQGSLPGVNICVHTAVSLHFLGMSSEPEVFSVHVNGQVLQQVGHKVSSVGLISGSTTTASMVAIHPGRWLLSSHIVKHIEAGMHGFVDVKKCDGFDAPPRRLSYAEKRQSKEWTYYIAAEEVIWDYALDMPDYADEDFKLQYLENSPQRIGQKYKKAMFTLYKNESFTQKSETQQRRNELGILGPVIRAQIRDVIKIIFKNMASRPYSIYPHGLTIKKSQEGFNYPAGGNQSHGVQPGETHTYVWEVAEEDEPLDGDSRCLTRMYYSAVDTPRDIASGLIGPLLICKSQSLNVRNAQLKADKEQHAVFAVFDENKSWYLEENVKKNCDQSKVNKADHNFYKSNVMHTINGYMFESGPLLGFCNGEVATWHVSSIGAQDFIQTATFYGHPFELNERTEDILSLYPMTGETITMNMDNIGVWLLASLNTHETTKGLRVKFQDVECFRDYEYEYDEGDETVNEWKEWKPSTLEDIKKEDEQKEKEEEKKKQEKTVEVDYYTDMFATEWGLRSLRNQSSDMDLLDLSFFDNDGIVDVPTENSKGNKAVLNKTGTADANVTMQSGQNSINLNNTFGDGNTTNVTIGSNEMDSVGSNLNNVTWSDRERTTENASAIFKSTNKTTPIITMAPNVSLDYITENLPFVVDILADSSEEVLTRGDVFTYDVPPASQYVRDYIHTDITTEDNVTAVSGNYTTKSLEAQNESMLMPILNYLLNYFNVNRTSNKTKLNISKDKLMPELHKNTVDNVTNVNEWITLQNTTTADTLKTAPGNKSVYNSYEDWTSLPNNTIVQLNNVTDLNVSLDVIGLNSTSQEATLENTLHVEPFYNETTNITNIIETTLVNITNVNLRSVNSTEFLETTSEKSTNFNVSEIAANITDLFNVTLDITNLNDSKEAFLDSDETLLENTTVNLSTSKASIEQVAVLNQSSSSDPIILSSSEELGASASSEEVVIYLKENIAEAIKTKSIKSHQAQNWTYDGTHETVPMEIPDHIVKYIGKLTSQLPPPPKKTLKKVTLRQFPHKGHGMKTKKRKEYVPQARSGLPFSPRGFNPVMSPRGSRPIQAQPVSEEEHLINNPIVIGVPRPDFSDYELYVPGDEPQHLDLVENVKGEEYEYVSYKDPYRSNEDMKHYNLDDATKYYLKNYQKNTKVYFIAAEEVEWDYAGYGQRQERSQLSSHETKFTKVVFRGYIDSSFTTPDIRGEIDEHLGILGPLIKAEVGQNIMVVFKNNASRPYSLHPNGVSYTKQTEGLSYEDGSKYWHKYDNEVQPNKTYTYLWTVTSMVGPLKGESDCRTWAYYSGVNPERDIQSGLIGPLLVCREGTLNKTIASVTEFMLLFMSFDESQSWYYEKNLEMIQRKTRRRSSGLIPKEKLMFHTINGIIYSLKGLRMYTNQLVRWHLINMGSPKDFQSVHFHGQTFFHKKINSYKQAVYPLLPGSFATLEMIPSKPGLWQLETEIGSIQQKGMQTLFLVLDDDCYHPLGLESGSVTDNQITAINSRVYWEPHLARLHCTGKYNAWSTDQNNSWVQVDFQRPVVISQIATQGAKQMFYSQYVLKYAISYSNDRRKWIFYKGDSKTFRKIFPGNQEAYDTKRNIFFPPIVSRFIRLHPIEWYNKATIRMEYYGCELDGCSVPLGMESRLIQDHQITASSTASSWYGGPWKPSLARLNKQGTINAWQARSNDMKQWLQVELPQVKKITGLTTQGAKALGKEMYVVSYSLQYSNDGLHWTDYTDDEVLTFKTFTGNTNNSDHVKNYIYPPIFSRFIRVIPRSWMNSITMRIELLGCDFE